MENLARKIANNVAISLDYDDEKKAVIAYGLTAIIQITVTILLIILCGIIVNALIEAIIICLSASILRKYSGGAHAGSTELCTFVSVTYCTITAFISKNLILKLYSPSIMFAAIIILYSLSFLIIYQKAPVDSPNKPIKTEKKRKRMRRSSFIILSGYCFLSVILLLSDNKFEMFNSFGISLLFGLAWQVLTLTVFGSSLLNKLNSLFIFLRKEHHK